MSLASQAVKKPITTALIFVALIILGVFSYQRLALDLLPEIESNSIMVLTAYPGASAVDIENNVSQPIETTLNGTSNLKNITSKSQENVSIVGLEFEFGTDIDIATNDVRDKLEVIKAVLPDDVENPLIFKFGASDIPIMLISVSADQSMNGLYKILDDKVANPLARISGVGSVTIAGTAQREIDVYCDPYKLDAYNIPIEAISQIIAMENRNTPVGIMDIGSNTYNLRVQGEFSSAEQLLGIVIGNAGGKTVYLRDVARVEDRLQERSQDSYTNGMKGATIMIQKQAGGNAVNISKEIEKKLPELQKTLPSDINLSIIMDSSHSIKNIMNSLLETILITMLIVMIVVLVFLGRFNSTIIVLITIPISLIGAFIYLYVSGNTLNIISLSSLSLAIGMVVDNAIVVLENITTHLARGSRPKQAAIYATKEVAISVIGGTLTLLAVFLPITLVSGLTGILFKQLGWIVSIIMLLSMVTAITLIPMMSSRMLKQNQKKGKLYTIFFTPIEKALDALDRGYGRLLNWSVHHRKVIIISAVVIFGGSLMLFPLIKTEFFPTQDNSRIGVNFELPIGTRKEITENVARAVNDEFVAKYPEIKVISYSVGQPDADNALANMSKSGTHYVSFNITLFDVADRKKGLVEICESMRRDLEKYTEMKTYNVLAGGSSGGMGGETAVEVEIYGYDFQQTDAVAADLMERLKASPMCSQVSVSREDYKPELQVQFDREKLSLHGLNVTTASVYLRNRINGSLASYYREDGDEYDIRIRFAPEFRETIESIENIMIYNDMGEGVRVRELGNVIETMTPPTIERKNRQRMITVTGVASPGYALSDVVGLANSTLDEMDLPSEVTWNLGGAYEEQQETFSDLMVLMVLIIILVFIVMASQFESLVDPFVIMFSIPFALTGVLLGLWMTNTPLGVMAMIGILILIGVVVKNGIVLIDYIKLCRERGEDIFTSVVTAGKSRLRPVLMTTLTTVLGMVPMAIGIGEGSEMWQSMGTTVAFGLTVSTLVTLILVPVIYTVFANRGDKRRRKKQVKMDVLEELAE